MLKKAIEIKNLKFSYPDGNCALRGINLDIDENESVAIIGPNGAGKSTLLLHMNGLLEGQGAIRIFDHCLSKDNMSFIRQKVGFVFQDPADQLFMPTVYEDVAFGPQNLGLSEDEMRKAADFALDAVGMLDKKKHLSHHLSLGEQKRVAIATVLSMSPQVLALDEPNSNLDPASRRHLINLLRGFNITKIIATHDLEMVLDLCPRAILLDKGCIIRDGRAEEILCDQALLESHGLEVPASLAAKECV